MKDDERKPSEQPDGDAKLPEERMEDLEPEADESDDVKGGDKYTSGSSPILF